MMSVAAEERALRSAARPSAHRPALSFAHAERASKPARSHPEVPGLPLLDLSDPVVRALPVSALAVAWAVIELTGGTTRGM